MTTTYVASVILPVQILNMNEAIAAGLTSIRGCPLCNVSDSSTSSTSNITSATSTTNNPALTKFGNFFLNLMVNEFNTLYGQDYVVSDFMIDTYPNGDQNSTCAYVLTSVNFVIIAYVQLGDNIHISIQLDETSMSEATTYSVP